MMNNTNNNILNNRFGMDMTVIKASVYKKHWSRIDPQTGEVHEGDRYLTLVACVPTVEFHPSVELYGKDNRPVTNGVYITTIGSTEGLVITKERIGLRTYQDHLESLGWKWIQTIPKSKGKSWEWVQKEGWSIILKHMKGEADWQKKAEILKVVDKLSYLSQGEDEYLTTLQSLVKLVKDF